MAIGWLLNLFKNKNPIVETMKALDGLTTSGAERAEIRREFIGQWVAAQSRAVVAEAQSSSWLASSWRPIVMLCFASILMYSFFVGPMFELKVVPVPEDLWGLMKIGIGGYIGGRSVEKLAALLPKKKLKGGE